MTLHLNALSGEELASIKAFSDWTGAQVMQALSEQKPLLPGTVYKMMFGDAEFTEERKVSELSEQSGESDAEASELIISVTVQRKESFQEDVDLALIKAAAALDLNLVKTLLSTGASAKFVHDPPGTWGATDRKSALHVAIQGLRNPEPAAVESWKGVIATLLEANADVNAKRSYCDWRGCGSSSTAFEMILPHAMKDAKLMQDFLEAGADPNTVSISSVHSMRSDGGSRHAVIHTATHSGNHQVLRTLLDAKADANVAATERISNERGYDRDKSETCLHIACLKGDVKGAALLLAHGADVNAERKELLHEDKTEEEMIEELPDMPQKSKNGGGKKKVITDDPRECGYVSPVRCVLEKKSSLHIALKSNDAALTTLLVCAGANVSAEYQYGSTLKSPEELCDGNATLLSALAGSVPLPSGSEVSSGEATKMYKILKVFKAWDKDGNGFIDEEEFTQALTELGLPADDITSFFNTADWNRDGQISYSEFVDWLYSGLAPSAVVDSMEA